LILKLSIRKVLFIVNNPIFVVKKSHLLILKIFEKKKNKCYKFIIRKVALLALSGIAGGKVPNNQE
jgi:hypothetical protein